MTCLLHSSLCVFPLFEKPVFFKLDSFSTDLHLSSPSFFFSWQKLAQSWSIELSGICLDNFSFHRETFYLADRFSTESWSIEVLLPSTNSYLSRFSARQILIAPQSIELRFSIYTWSTIRFSFSHFSLDRKYFSLPPNTLFSLKSPHPLHFQPRSPYSYGKCS